MAQKNDASLASNSYRHSEPLFDTTPFMANTLAQAFQFSNPKGLHCIRDVCRYRQYPERLWPGTAYFSGVFSRRNSRLLMTTDGVAP